MAEQFKITGKLINVGDTETVGAKGFKKRTFVIRTDDKFPQEVPFELPGEEKTRLIDGFALDSDVTVHFNLRGREWNGKWFGSLEAWRIEGEKKTMYQEIKDKIDVSGEDLPF